MLLGGIGYSGAGGAAGHATSASMGSGAGGTYTFSASYDADARLSSLSVTNASTSAVLFQSQRGYDAASNVTAVNTTLAAGTGGTDNQAFCYDEQNRLVWAGSSGTPSRGGTLTPGTLTSAAYTQTFAYDTLDRLTSGPLGSYTYGDSAHLHAVTAIGSNYTATYDAVGDMTCRAPDNTTTCAGTPTGAQLGYDSEGRLATWQNAPTNPTATDSFLYDGAGNRVEQSVTVNGSITTTTTYVAGGLEEIAANGVSTTLTKYFTGAGGLPTAERVGTNGPLSYLASDGQGTVSEALDGGGTVTFAQLYTPYGAARYSSGSSPTTLGYTGQRADGATGLDDYQARYYDPVADGLNRYGYVRGNPETATDPSGHYACYDDPCTRGGGGSGSPTPSKETAPSSREPSICDDGPAICQQIISEFHNTDTQNTLLYIAEAGSSIGMRLLLWILKIGKTLGDSFIRWDGQTQGGAGYTDSGGFIHLHDLGDATNANTLIHEGVEAYYAIQYGVRTQASQQMDYLAQRYSGMYKSESGGKYDKNNGCDSDGENCMYWGAYGLSFQQWRRTADGKGYAGQPLIQAEVQFGVPIAPGYVLYRTGPFGLLPGAKAVNGGSIADLDAAYSELSVPQPIYDPAPIL